MTHLGHRPSFVGRAPEGELLLERLAALGGGRGSVVLLAGEPGIGKTSLAEQLAEWAQEGGIRTLWGRCYEGEGAPAFWPWLQILRRLTAGFAASPGVGRDRGFDGGGLAPALQALLASAPQPAALRSSEARFRLFDDITMLLKAEAAAAPLVLLLDDLHWADASSLLLLEFLAPAIADAPMLVVGAYRDNEVRDDHPLGRTVGALLRQSHVSHATLTGLSAAEIAGLIDAVAGVRASDDLAAAIIRQTEGNPLFATETLRLLATEGGLQADDGENVFRRGIPQTVRAVISRRLDGLSTACNAALTLAAIAGREFSVPLLLGSGETAAESLLEALAEAEVARIIAPIDGAAGHYRFTHTLIQETIYESIASVRRMRLHGRVGEALAALHADDADPPLAELTRHFLQAAPVGDAAQAATYARRAGDRALAMLAYEEAARLYALGVQALDLMPQSDPLERGELLLALGEAHTRAGDADAGQAAFWQAADVARALRRRGGSDAAATILARAALGIAGLTLPARMVATPLIEMLAEALAALGEADSPLRAQVLARLATDLRRSEDQRRRDALSAEAVMVARRAGDPRSLAVVLIGRHNVWRGTSRLEEQLALATEALRQAQAAEDSDLAMWAYRLRVVDLMEIGDRVAFEQDAAEYARLAERLREPYHLWQSAVWGAMRSLLDGNFSQAEALAEHALALGLRGPADLARLFHALQLVAVRTEYGSPDEAIAAAAPVLEQFPQLDGTTASLLPLYLAAGRRDEAQREYDRLIAATPTGDVTRYRRRGVRLAVVPHLAHAAAALGDTLRAATLYAMLLPDARHIAMASPGIACYGPVAHYLGLLAAAIAGAAHLDPGATRSEQRTGMAAPASAHSEHLAADGDAVPTWEHAAGHFEDAIAAETRLGARAWLARSSYEYAAMLLEREQGAGEPEKEEGGSEREGAGRMRGLLEQASAGAHELGMVRLAERANLLLATLATPAPHSRLSTLTPAGLSSREVEVLRLLAAGKTNAEIAAQLVLSRSTVKRHAENIYLKIGARRRADATAFALRHGLIEP